MRKHNFYIGFFMFLIVFPVFLLIMPLVYANTYISDVSFIVPNTVYMTNERIEFKGNLSQANYTNSGTLVSSSRSLSNALINFTIKYGNGTYLANYTLTTDSGGAFYSRSNFYTNATEINTSTTPGTYYIRAEYKDLNNNLSFSEIEIIVINKTLDLIRVGSEKATYNPSEPVLVNIEAVRMIGDKTLYVVNVSINGSLRNSTKTSLQTFNCTTGNNGKCTVNLTAPSTYGNYILELNNYKVFSSFSVVPFSYNLYMKDELGKSFKNVFALGEQARVEVKINNASSSDIYTFSGYIADKNGNSVKSVDSTTLNSNNSFISSFLFSVDSIQFSYGAYSARITVTKTGDGSISALTSFEVEDWTLSVNKKTAGSGFEYEYSTFPNKTLKFEALPSFRANGSIIPAINATSFIIYLKDNLHNVVTNANASWNATCGKSGCYEFSVIAPSDAGEYTLYSTLLYGGDSQTNNRMISVISGVMSAQSTDKDGNLKELFGTSEYAYLTLSSYNLTSSFNLTNAEVFLVSYMNGSEFSYTHVNNFTGVNSSTSTLEWAWNSTLQIIKLDVPKAGGVYNVFIFGNNRSLGAEAKFVVNPYEVCSVPKDTQGSVSSGYYYVWQFKTSDTVYFEIKLTQANNPLGRASALNSTNSSVYGMGAACNIDTAKKQVVNNATLTVVEVRNLESGAVQSINSSSSVCQASDTSGGYTCTVKPSGKWDGGVNNVKFNIKGQEGTTSIFYSRFEARAFYMYGWSNTWQNSPSDNITLNVRLYEAGGNWWSSYGGSGGISGTVTVKRVEYQGRDGEWIWPPVDSGYNVTNISSASITSGTGSITLPVSKALNGIWKTGYYRVILQATTGSGDSDYGYAWFSTKLWDVYGQPIECLASGCNYKGYFNSKENVTLYIKISKAGNYNYNDYGGSDIWGNVSVKVKNVQDCRKWPCKDLNSSQYTSSTINVNQSSPWYWNTNSTASSNYILQINSTSGSWGTGWYSVVLNVNETDTGYAWFNTIAFYIETKPTNASGDAYKYSIRGNQPMYFNVTSVKSYKYGYWYTNSSGASVWLGYNASDYINVTLDSAVLRTWDQTTWLPREFNYPSELNITPNNITGNGLFNITNKNGTWTTGYYYGELTLKSADNETSTGWLWFSVQPFRVSMNTVGSLYNLDFDQCVNTTVIIYDSDWYSSVPLVGNYSITNVYEDIWSGMSYNRVSYTNYTNSSFNATANMTFCPNNGSWTGGSWGGYHYLNIIVKDNNLNDTQTGWLSFRTIPFQVSWSSGTGGNRLTNANFNVSVNISKASTGAIASGNLTRIYQWRYDNYRSTLEEYVFAVRNSTGISCWSNVSGQCTVNGTQNITIYPPSSGWKSGYNYLYSEWTKNNDATATVQDWSGIYFEGRDAYNGYFSNTDVNGNWKYYFVVNENLTIKLILRDNSYNAAPNISITSVQYAFSSNCWTESCLSYTTATYSPTTTDSNGEAILKIAFPSSNWTRGMYYIKATAGGVTITGGTVRVKDFTPPNITALTSPVNNATYNTSLLFSATTSKNAQCSAYIINYDNFYNWYCGGWNSTNSTNSSLTSQTINACNITKYNYNGSVYQTEWASSNYWSRCDVSSCSWTSNSGFTTGGTSHTYTFNVTNYTAQHYGFNVWCYDDDYNYVTERAGFKINHTGTG